MDRRGFLRSLVGGVAAASAVRTWPFRIFSFPTDIVTPPAIVDDIAGWKELDRLLKEIYAPVIREQLFNTKYGLHMLAYGEGAERRIPMKLLST